MTKQERIAGTETVEREALIAFYELDEMPMKARQLREGAELDFYDRRALDALRAAFGKLAA